VINWIRQMLIEDVYRSISYVFPEMVKLPMSEWNGHVCWK